MDFLIKLLAVDAPTGTSLKSAELHFRGLFPWWMGLTLFVLLGAYVTFLYFKERARLGLLARLSLAMVRTVLFGIVLFLLCRPTLLAEFEGQRKRGVAILLDNSKSLTLQDRRITPADNARVAIALNKVAPTTPLDKINPTSIQDLPKDPSRQDLVKGVLQNPELKLFANLEKVGPLRTYLFSSALTPIHEESDKGDTTQQTLAKFDAQGVSTALADGIFGILQRKDGDIPAAIVVVTDGRDNSSKFTMTEAAFEAARLGVPIHVYGVGSADAGSLQLREVTLPPSGFVDDELSVPFHFRAHGLKKGQFELVVKLGDKIVAKKDINVAEGDDLREALKFAIPKGREAEETLKLTASIQLKGSDIFKDSIVKDFRVIDRKIKVLVIEHAPRFEYKFLQAALLRDKRIDPSFLLLTADPKAVKNEPKFLEEFPKQREKFFDAKYNVIILGDIPAPEPNKPGPINKEQLEWIKEWVEKNRGGLIFIAGRQHMPSEYVASPLAEVLPVEFIPTKAKLPTDDRTPDYPPTLTELGQRTEMLSLGETPEESAKIWQSLPGFYGFYPITKLRPGAQALIVNPRVKMEDKPMPVLVTQYYGRGQVLFFGTDESWRWRANSENKHFVRFWGQLIYQMGLPSLLGSTSNRVQMALDRSEAVLDRPGSIYVRLLDKDFRPRTEPQVEATIDFLDAKGGAEKSKKLQLLAIPGREGEYQGFLPNDKPGRYEVKVHNPELTTFSFRVDLPPRHELEESGLAEYDLRDLAKQSGGNFYREEDLHKLSTEVKPQLAPFTRRQEILLWTPLMFLAFLALITLEWVGRKFSNLM